MGKFALDYIPAGIHSLLIYFTRGFAKTPEFFHLGLDSLQAVEIKNYLENNGSSVISMPNS